MDKKDIQLWLFVDRDGTEYMSNSKPQRTEEYIERINRKWRNHAGQMKYVAALKVYNSNQTISGWYNYQRDDDYGTFGTGDELTLDDAVELPSGFIKHHTGKQLTFDDEPILYTY